MIRKTLAAILTVYWEFIKRHPLVSLIFSFILMAACIAGIYLIIVNFPSFTPCMRGSCSR